MLCKILILRTTSNLNCYALLHTTQAAIDLKKNVLKVVQMEQDIVIKWVNPELKFERQVQVERETFFIELNPQNKRSFAVLLTVMIQRRTK